MCGLQGRRPILSDTSFDVVRKGGMPGPASDDDDDFFFALDMLRSLTTDIWIYVQPEVQRTKDTKSVIPR